MQDLQTRFAAEIIPAAQDMRSSKLLAALACCVALAHFVQANDNTHIDNHSKAWTIIATTSYPGGKSKFIDRKIAPGGSGGYTNTPQLHPPCRSRAEIQNAGLDSILCIMMLPCISSCMASKF